MIVLKKDIPEAVKSETQEAITYLERPKPTNGMVACVFVQQFSPRRWNVGWRWTKRGTPIGEIQQDCHATAYKDQEIVWVWTPPFYIGQDVRFETRGGSPDGLSGIGVIVEIDQDVENKYLVAYDYLVEHGPYKGRAASQVMCLETELQPAS